METVQTLTFDEEEEEDGPVEFVPIPDWSCLTLDQIYEILNPKKSDKAASDFKRKLSSCLSQKLCYIGNNLLKTMTDKGFLAPTVKKSMAVIKNERELQKTEFVKEKENKCTFVQNFLRANCYHHLNNDGQVVLPREYTENMLARVMMLGKDPNSLIILEQIFKGPSKEDARQECDDKTLRGVGLWRILCEKFFNNESWKPMNEFSEYSYVKNIDPSNKPDEDWSETQLRETWSKLRTHYTKISFNFSKSGQLQQGADNGEGDDLFYSCYANLFDKEYPQSMKGLFMFVKLIFRDEAPRFCTRGLNTSLQLDIGASPQSKGLGVSSGRRQAISDEGIKKAFEPTKVENELMIAQTQALQQNIRLANLKTYREELLNEESELADPDLDEDEREELKKYYKLLKAKKRRLMIEG